MNQGVTRLIPSPRGEFPLQGLYLGHGLQLRGKPGQPFVFSNFITSLDGRISISRPGSDMHRVPEATANPRDWRLYQELAGQADLLITSGRFIRQSQAGEAQDMLPVGAEAEYNDIREWRTAQGLAPQPDIVIMSGSLDLPVEALDAYSGRRLMVLTGNESDMKKADQLEDRGIEVIRAGNGSQVDGRLIKSAMGERGYTSIYAIAGPGVFYTLLSAGAIDRLYLTTVNNLLGGKEFDTLTRGPLLKPTCNLKLGELYLDLQAADGTSQLFGVYEPASR